MLSLLIPLIFFCILLFLNKRRAAGRGLPSADSWRAEVLEAAIELVEAAAASPAEPVATMPFPPAPTRIATVPVTAGDRGARATRYLLDSDDPRPRSGDRVARLQQAMRGPGICSPCSPS